METEVEEWKSIDRLPGYEFSSLGRVRSYLRSGKSKRRIEPVIKKQYKTNGYMKVSIQISNNKSDRINVAVLILEAFKGPKPSPELECCHGNDIRHDNRITNLRWDTHKSNMEDKVKNGNTCHGIKQHLSKLTEEQVREIIGSPESSSKLGKKYGVTSGNIRKIKSRKYWKHINA